MKSGLGLADNVFELLEKTDGLPGRFKGMKNVITFLNKEDELAAFAEGQTAPPGEKGGVMERVISIAELYSGVLGVAGAALPFFPPAWVVAGGVAAVGAISYLSEENERKEILASERRKRDERADRTFQMSTASETSYIKNIDKIAEQRWAKKKPDRILQQLDANRKAYGSSSLEQAITISSAISDDMTPNVFIPKSREDDIRLKKDSKQSHLSPPNTYNRLFDLEQHLKYEGQTKGRSGFELLAGKSIADAEKYDLEHHEHTAYQVREMVKSTAGFLTAHANPEMEDDDAPANHSHRSSSRQVVNVNINRPMIGNFTINTNSAMDGLNDLRREVEEILLEIVNSANTM